MNIVDQISLIMAKIDHETDQRLAEAGQTTLGELAAKLEPLDQSLEVSFSDGCGPGEYMSYRGYYRYIAIDRSAEKKTVADFLKMTREAIGATFEGYKGGDFTMTKNTPIFVSEYGACSDYGIIGVSVDDGKVILKVGKVDS